MSDELGHWGLVVLQDEGEVEELFGSRRSGARCWRVGGRLGGSGRAC